MSQGAEQIRLAIGVFDSPSSLWRTVLALMDDGLMPEQFCLLTTAPTAAEISPPAGIDKDISDADRYRVSRLYEQVETWPESGNSRRIVATSGPLLNSLLKVQMADAASKNPGVSGEHMSEMLKQVRHGGLLLVIRSLSPAQQRLSTRALLDQSPHSVKTYDFAVSADQAQKRQG